MTDVNNRAYDTDLLDVLSERVLVGDGAMGTQLQAAGLIEANTFGCSLVNRWDDDIADKVCELSLNGSELGVQTSIG